MNEVIQNILTRRSIRAYTEDQISNDDLNTLLEAAKFAPSGMGTQAWHFTAVQNIDKINKLISAIKEALQKSPVEQLQKIGSNPNFNPFYNAPTIIITAYDKNSPTKESDSAVALENIMLAAHSLNIGSCWIHALGIVGDDPSVRSILTELGIPENYAIFGTAALGFSSKGEPKASPRKEGTVNIVK
ncbi:nitroreductase [Clostridium sp. BL-8]|uniref:nitroreductase family protein n=1 Tax=Clostridium sp. BL-8 TaxID=349938 RepID=UPI00098C4314|nr:nitroreductase [Clostridium sp. BL-8]OOM80209.1 NADPH-flavin oxidoreductase [Clostridium sp. BL-8]